MFPSDMQADPIIRLNLPIYRTTTDLSVVDFST